MFRRIRFVALGGLVVGVVALAPGGFGNSDVYFPVTVVNGMVGPIQLHQCYDSHCRSLEPPELVAPGGAASEWGSSTVHQPFLVTGAGHASKCLDLFFAKQPAHPVRITMLGLATGPNASRC